jgi:hypothetical protein
MLAVFQDAGVHPKAADDPHAAALTVARHSDRGRSAVIYDMLTRPGSPVRTRRWWWRRWGNSWSESRPAARGGGLTGRGGLGVS